MKLASLMTTLMPHSHRNLLAVLSGFLVGLAWTAPGFAQTTYTTTVTADPAGLTCGYFVNVEECAGAQAITPVLLAQGDTYNINITYTSPLLVPGSQTNSNAYVGLGNAALLFGSAIPGSDVATVSSTPVGYIGPSNPLTAYTTVGYLNEYVAAVAICCGAPPNPGFSLTGMNSTLTIDTADPSQMTGVFWGYSAVLPATPATLSLGGGSVPGSPVILPPKEGIGQITDAIGGGQADFYQFNWVGGGFDTAATVTGATTGDDLVFELLNANTLALVGTPVPLDSGDGFTGTVRFGDLPAGAYEIGIEDNDGSDPNFTITFDTPIEPGIPEPATWVLMVSGVGLVGSGLRIARRGVMALS